MRTLFITPSFDFVKDIQSRPKQYRIRLYKNLSPVEISQADYKPTEKSPNCIDLIFEFNNDDGNYYLVNWG